VTQQSELTAVSILSCDGVHFATQVSTLPMYKNITKKEAAGSSDMSLRN
jgi:hypothetical protein